MAWDDAEIVVSLTSVFWMSFSRTTGLVCNWFGFTKFDWLRFGWLEFERVVIVLTPIVEGARCALWLSVACNCVIRLHYNFLCPCNWNWNYLSKIIFLLIDIFLHLILVDPCIFSGVIRNYFGLQMPDHIFCTWMVFHLKSKR